jgi:2'-5' RNA ligase
MVVEPALQPDEGARDPVSTRGTQVRCDARGMNGADGHRLFFALWPDAAVRSRIDAASQAVAHDRAVHGRRVRTDRLHLTLHFLGAVPDGGLDAALDAGEAVDAARFELVLDRAGGFSRARVTWLGCTDVPERLIDLHAQLRDALVARGLPVESRAYAPHVTVQRDVRGAVAETAIEPIAWPVEAFVLIDSRVDRGYVEVGRWLLRG